MKEGLFAATTFDFDFVGFEFELELDLLKVSVEENSSLSKNKLRSLVLKQINIILLGLKFFYRKQILKTFRRKPSI